MDQPRETTTAISHHEKKLPSPANEKSDSVKGNGLQHGWPEAAFSAYDFLYLLKGRSGEGIHKSKVRYLSVNQTMVDSFTLVESNTWRERTQPHAAFFGFNSTI